MAGGIKAWKGMVATGGPEAGIAYFAPAENMRDIVALAWGMEEGSRRFYQGIMEQLTTDRETGQLLANLMEAENHHQQYLRAAFERIAGRRITQDDLQAVFGDITAGEIMEGGVPVRQALEWTRDQEIQDVLELAMGLEINSYDLYIKMSRKAETSEEKLIFRDLAQEEQEHLERLGSLLDEHLGASAYS
jgi:sulfur-carrier protein adenylyltransferase/sulfurtransferase